MGILKCPKSSLMVLLLFGTSPSNGSNHTEASAYLHVNYIRDPKPFECTIKPRSEHAIELVKEACGTTNC